MLLEDLDWYQIHIEIAKKGLYSGLRLAIVLKARMAQLSRSAMFRIWRLNGNVRRLLGIAIVQTRLKVLYKYLYMDPVILWTRTELAGRLSLKSLYLKLLKDCIFAVKRMYRDMPVAYRTVC